MFLKMAFSNIKERINICAGLLLVYICFLLYSINIHSSESKTAFVCNTVFRFVNPCFCPKKVNFQFSNKDRSIVSTCSDERSSLGFNQNVISYTFYIPNEKRRKFKAAERTLHGKNETPVERKQLKDTFAREVLTNLRGMREHFPGWFMRVYTNFDPDPFLCHIICSNDDLFWCDIRKTYLKNHYMSNYFAKTWKFLPMGDPTIELFSLRDFYSELSNQEAPDIHDWLGIESAFNHFKDFPDSFADRSILGGLWKGNNSLIGYKFANNLLLHLFEHATKQKDSLQCYNCYYQDTNYPLYFYPSIPEDPSCRMGAIPDESLMVDCSEMSFGGEGKEDNVTYTCMDLTMNGIFHLGPTFKWNGTIRTCVASYKGNGSVFTEECLDEKLGMAASLSTIPEIRTILEQFTYYFNNEVTDTLVCNCNDELCNRVL